MIRNFLIRTFCGEAKRHLWLVSGVFFLFIVILSGFVAYLVKLPPQTVAYGASIGPFDVGGMSYDEARQLISSQTNAMENRGIDFIYKNINFNISSVYNSLANAELSVTVYDYDAEGSLSAAFALGHSGPGWQIFAERLRLRLFGQKVPLVHLFRESQVLSLLQENFSKWESPVTDAGYILSGEGRPEVKIINESSGKIFNYELATAEFMQRLNNLDPSDVRMKLNQTEPTIKKAVAESLKPAFERFLAKGPLSFVLSAPDGKDKKFVAPPLEWGNWIKIEKRGSEAALAMNKSLVAEYFKEKIAPLAETPVQEARLNIKDGKAVEFIPSQSGEIIDWEKMWPAIENLVLTDNGLTETALVRQTVQPQTSVASTNDLGIKEIIGLGRTTFAGSPANRRHNIALGAKTLNGILIAPGEKFSLLKALGPVDGEHGYLPELVIKKDKTVPEFGGGLCQIATTIFRAALASGLRILERQSHSYRVPYYEPAGVDATIYDPSPDFRFLNDTDRYILIQSRVEGNFVTFEFWGA
ncbi:MAG: VanW family protein, partial [Patescibacteria group bacterium]